MRFLHTADLHLGKVIYNQSLLDDQKFFFEKVFYKTIEEKNIDAVIISGDIFDRAIPTTDAIRLFDDVLNTVTKKMGKKMIIITGNHDSGERLMLGCSLLRKSGVYFTTELNAEIKPLTLEDEYGKYDIYSLPYFEPPVCRTLFKDESIKGFSKAYQKVIDKINQNKNQDRANIVLAHIFLTGGQACESESQLYVGGSGDVPRELFKDFTYTALGHLHSPQRPDEHIRYSGSPLKYSFSEVNHKKVLLIADIKGKNDVKTEEIPVVPRLDVQVIEGSFDELIKSGKENPNHHYLKIKLTDKEPIINVMAKLREVYPNVLELDTTYGEGNQSYEGLKNKDIKRLSEDEVIEAFFNRVYDLDLTSEEKEFISSLNKH